MLHYTGQYNAALAYKTGINTITYKTWQLCLHQRYV